MWYAIARTASKMETAKPVTQLDCSLSTVLAESLPEPCERDSRREITSLVRSPMVLLISACELSALLMAFSDACRAAINAFSEVTKAVFTAFSDATNAAATAFSCVASAAFTAVSLALNRTSDNSFSALIFWSVNSCPETSSFPFTFSIYSYLRHCHDTQRDVHREKRTAVRADNLNRCARFTKTRNLIALKVHYVSCRRCAEIPVKI